MTFSSAALCLLVCSSLLAPCSDDDTPAAEDAGTDPMDGSAVDASEPVDSGLDAADADPVLACPDVYYTQQRAQIRGATPSADGLGWCCPPTDTPSCNCTPTGGFVSERCECGRDYGVCDGHPNDWRRGMDEHGCDRWWVGMTNVCNPYPHEDGGSEPDEHDSGIGGEPMADAGSD